MLNQIVVVGRLAKNPEIKELESGIKTSVITLAVPRSFKNLDGEYDVDYIDITLWEPIASRTVEYCRQGDIIGVKGRVQRLDGEELTLVAEKVTFLSSNSKEEA